MSKPDKTHWLSATYDEMNAKVDGILRAAGFTRTDSTSPGYVVFSVFETVNDAVKEDLSDWGVRHPDFTSTFAAGKVQFLLGYNEESFPVYSAGYLNPTWADVIVEAEGSCRARGAPELDHVFLEAVEEIIEAVDGEVARYELVWGS